MLQAVLLLLFPAVVLGQSGLTFEVASVKPAKPLVPGESRGTKALTDRVTFEYTTLRYCLAFAYGVKQYQIAGPAWLGESRYDILAKGPEGTTREQLPGMMQTLLAERFGMKVHREEQPFSGLVLVGAKGGAKLGTPVAGGVGGGMRMSLGPSGGKLEAKGLSLPMLAQQISNLLGLPVENQTEIQGLYDFTLEYTADEVKGGTAIQMTGSTPPPVDAEPGISIYTSIQKYGLRLEARKVPLAVIVVDHVEKTPTEN